MKQHLLFLILLISLFCISSCADTSFEKTENETSITGQEQNDAGLYSFCIDDGVSLRIAEELNRHQALDSFTAKPLTLDIDSVFSVLSSLPAEGLERELTEYPSNMGSTEVLSCGEPPFYDIWLNIETVPTDSRIYFEQLSYSFLSAVFEPREDSARLRRDDLSFAQMDEAKAMVEAVADGCGFRMTALSGGSLSVDALQSLYDQRKEDGTLREDRYGSAGSTVKDQVAVADHSTWTQEDECYYLHGQAAFSDIPIWGSDVNAYVNSAGICCFTAAGLLEPFSQNNAAALQSDTALLGALDRITAAMYSDSKMLLHDAQLYYLSTDGTVYVPAWLFTLDYTFINPDGVEEMRSAEVWLNACNAEEIIIKEAE